MINYDDFIISKWFKQAMKPGAIKDITSQFDEWAKSNGGIEVFSKAQKLYQFVLSDKVDKSSKILAAAALLYIITPFDISPDFIPILGWVDDLAIFAMVWSHIESCVDALNPQLESKGH